MASDRDLDERPIAGQRYRFALGLVFGSVGPVTLTIMVMWSVLDLTSGGYVGAIVLLAGFLAMIGPYVVGWIRSYLAVAGGGVALLEIEHVLTEQPLWLIVAASLAAVAVIGAATWFSLRFGHVWRPADARPAGAARSSMWPYPYA